jgi:hypothetical protein
MLVTIAAVLFCIVIGALAVFQACLAAGLPWGRFAWGGKNDVLPRRERISSVIAIVVYVLFAGVVLARAGLIGLPDGIVVRILAWVVAAYLLLSAVPNLLSKSRSEKLVMTPVSLVLGVLALVVAI